MKSRSLINAIRLSGISINNGSVSGFLLRRTENFPVHFHLYQIEIYKPYLKPEEQKEFFVQKCKIALDYGAWFRGNGENFVRFNLATSREIVEKAADAVIAAMAEKAGA